MKKIFADPFNDQPTFIDLIANSIYLTENNIDEVAKYIHDLNNCFLNIQIPSEMVQYDVSILEEYNNQGTHQRGIKNYDLIIGIIGFGCYGFTCGNYQNTTKEYYREKLNISSELLTSLFNKLRTLKGGE